VRKRESIYYLRQGGSVIAAVCLSVCTLASLRKNFPTDLHEIFRESWQFKFGGDPDHRLDRGIVFRIRHCWEIRKVVSGHKSAAASSHSFILIRQMATVVIKLEYTKVDNFY